MPSSSSSSARIPLLASLLLACVLFLYIIVRAIKVGFTHDESSSFMNLVHEPVRDLFFNERNWRAANNHPLNTLCMQAGYYFFGAEEWALRWGSLLGGVVFFIYAFRTVRLWLPVNSWWFFGAFCVVLLNHFVLDFFSLARGYGLCMAFEMASLYYFFRWIQVERRTDLFKMGSFLALGLLANFTLLDILAGVFLTLSLAFYIKNKAAWSLIKWLRILAMPAVPVIVTGMFIFQPMRWIRARGEFEYGPQAFWETWRVLIERYVYHPVPDQVWWKVAVVALGTILFLAIGFDLVKRYRKGSLNAHSPVFYAALLLVFTMLATMGQHYLFGANYLIGRTALLFYPLLALLVVLYLIDLRTRFAKAQVVWILVGSGVVLNFCSQLNLRYALEWPYDEHTREAVLYANQQSDPLHKLQYGVGWEMYSTTLFYQQTRGLFRIETVEYNASHDDPAWVKSKPFDLIYIDKKLQPAVADQYAVLPAFPSLMVKKSN